MRREMLNSKMPGVELVAWLGRAGLKLRIAPKPAGLLRWFGSRDPFARFYARLLPTTRKKWNQRRLREENFNGALPD